MTREELIEKILKVEALFAGTNSAGEKQAAGNALDRLKTQLAAAPEPKTEFKISIEDPWKRQLFLALCRRNQIHPYRLPRQRRGTVMIRTTRAMLDEILWPQFLELSKLLHSYLDEATRDIIARGVHGDLSEADERPGIGSGD
jgi:hypothetical protein